MIYTKLPEWNTEIRTPEERAPETVKKIYLENRDKNNAKFFSTPDRHSIISHELSGEKLSRTAGEHVVIIQNSLWEVEQRCDPKYVSADGGQSANSVR